MEGYKDALKIDKQESESYYNFSLQNKTEQQTLLEKLIAASNLRPARIADIACGGGGASYHLSAIYPDASYTLIDINEDAIAQAREATGHLKVKCLVGDIYDLPLETDCYDLVICWQTLSWITKPKVAVRELVRICKPGGRVYASSLFNSRQDVDVYSTVIDHTRRSASEGLTYAYNTYSVLSVREWIDGLVSSIQLHDFDISIDLDYGGRGLGTSTVKLKNGRRLQISGGMLLNWGILELKK